MRAVFCLSFNSLELRRRPVSAGVGGKVTGGGDATGISGAAGGASAGVISVMVSGSSPASVLQMMCSATSEIRSPLCWIRVGAKPLDTPLIDTVMTGMERGAVNNKLSFFS